MVNVRSGRIWNVADEKREDGERQSNVVFYLLRFFEIFFGLFVYLRRIILYPLSRRVRGRQKGKVNGKKTRNNIERYPLESVVFFSASVSDGLTRFSFTQKLLD